MEITKENVNAVISDIFNKSNDIVCDVNTYFSYSGIYTESSINLSSIATKLIQGAGRWCETYASDFIITWDVVREAVTKHMQTTDILPAEVFAFGMRKNGVDHNEYIVSRLCNDSSFNSDIYRKIYAVQILDHADDDSDGKRVYVTLKNITSETIYYHIDTD